MNRNILNKLKFWLFIILSVFCINFAYPEENNLYSELVKLNGAYVNSASSVLVTMKCTYYYADKKPEEGTLYALFNKYQELLKIELKTGNIYILDLDSGCYFLNNKLRSPLKVSGNYSIESAQVSDMLSIDFSKDYELEEFDTKAAKFLLKRTNNKLLYPYISVTVQNEKGTGEKIYELTFMDRSQKPVRKLQYTTGNVSGIRCFKKVVVYKSVLDNAGSSSYDFIYTIDSIEKTTVNSALFNSVNMKDLCEYMEQLLQ